MVMSLRVQVLNVRFFGKGAIFAGSPLDAQGKPTSESIVVRVPQSALGAQVLFAGDLWALQGDMEKYKGRRQFRANSAILVYPYGKNMIALLSGKRFPGIGPVKAQALWQRFGLGLRDILDDGDVDSLAEVVTREIADVLVESWQNLNPGSVVEWLDEHRFPVALGQRLVDFYGPTAADKLCADPYRLLAFGESWSRVDEVALQQIGINRDAPQREHAAVAMCLYDAWDKEGSTALPHDLLLERVHMRLKGSLAQAQRAVTHCYDGGGWLHDKASGMYQTSGAWLMEQYIAHRIGRMISFQDMPPQIDALYVHPSEYGPQQRDLISKTLIAWQEEHHALGDQQKAAIRTALTNQFAIISGGAGVGKTTVLKALYAGLDVLGSEVVQMALSGRAARRMQEATERQAMTIEGFKRSRTRNDDKSIAPNPDLIDTRTYVVDEASMVDVATLYQILRRIGPGGRLILVGDDLQLPPIGAGLTFHLLCRESAPAQRVHLTQVYRQEGTTGIPAISQAIREGRWPEIPGYGGPGIGVSILTCSENEAADVISGIYDDLVRAEEGGEEEVQILATTKGEKRETPFSVTGINKDLYRRRLSDRRAVKVTDGLAGFCEGCPIMFTENDWDRGITNGSLGTIVEAFPEPMLLVTDDPPDEVRTAAIQQYGSIPVPKKWNGHYWLRAAENLVVIMPLAEGQVIKTRIYPGRVVMCKAEFDGKAHCLSEHDILYRLQRGFAITVHKAQGSQWNRIVVPIAPSQLLDRTLLYTAITRGVRQVVLVGDIKAAATAAKHPPRALDRICGLEALLNRIPV